ncbi:aromatic ring-hydroxylating dioxygenase subunit alpha [Dactylosporangium sp. NPDC049525]|uniref:aromatic ring-hydroxylating dioxygenase subunit alpha n=1 Tax=Dactylosporangium sp. NPDC049525 TaxID=3154730 RepID=UPI00343E56CC
MLSKENSELLTRTGAQTPGGQLMRCYWQPVALGTELAAGDPVPLQVMGEELVLFRAEDGTPRLLGRHCPHRGADLSYGRLEDGGLRCLYHGWLWAPDGRCLAQPGEPPGSRYFERVRNTAYPCEEAGGIVFAWMGPGEPPPLPRYGFMDVPEESRAVVKVRLNCNYLQGNEGNLDPQHLSFLHARLDRFDVHRADPAPEIEVTPASFGARIVAVRTMGERRLVRVSNFITPNASSFPTPVCEPGGYQMHWHVPIDDVTHHKYVVQFTVGVPIDRERAVGFDPEEMNPDFSLKRHAANRYLQDRATMQDQWFAGLGSNFEVHDAYAVESQGPIQDRTTEKLGTTDRAIAASRRVLLDGIAALQRGEEPAGDPAAADALITAATTVDGDADWHAWLSAQAQPLEGASWPK